jgi:hypothetical protein
VKLASDLPQRSPQTVIRSVGRDHPAERLILIVVRPEPVWMALLGDAPASRRRVVEARAWQERQDRIGISLMVLPELDADPSFFDDAVRAPMAVPQAPEVGERLLSGTT